MFVVGFPKKDSDRRILWLGSLISFKAYWRKHIEDQLPLRAVFATYLLGRLFVFSVICCFSYMLYVIWCFSYMLYVVWCFSYMLYVIMVLLICYMLYGASHTAEGGLVSWHKIHGVPLIRQSLPIVCWNLRQMEMFINLLARPTLIVGMNLKLKSETTSSQPSKLR